MDFKTSPLPVSPHAVADSPNKLHPNLRPWSTRRLAEYPKMRLNPFSSSWKFSRNLINPGATCKLCLSFWVIRIILVCSPRHKESQENSTQAIGWNWVIPISAWASGVSSKPNKKLLVALLDLTHLKPGFSILGGFIPEKIQRLGIATQSLNLLTTSLL